MNETLSLSKTFAGMSTAFKFLWRLAQSVSAHQKHWEFNHRRNKKLFTMSSSNQIALLEKICIAISGKDSQERFQYLLHDFDPYTSEQRSTLSLKENQIYLYKNDFVQTILDAIPRFVRYTYEEDFTNAAKRKNSDNPLGTEILTRSIPLLYTHFIARTILFTDFLCDIIATTLQEDDIKITSNLLHQRLLSLLEQDNLYDSNYLVYPTCKGPTDAMAYATAAQLYFGLEDLDMAFALTPALRTEEDTLRFDIIRQTIHHKISGKMASQDLSLILQDATYGDLHRNGMDVFARDLLAFIRAKHPTFRSTESHALHLEANH